jgi:hypothetical protein
VLLIGDFRDIKPLKVKRLLSVLTAQWRLPEDRKAL